MKRSLDYQALKIEPGDLRSAVESAKSQSWVGWNITLPHKVSIMPLMDRLDASAKEIGAVNVARFIKDGAIGYNTDAEGFMSPLRRSGFAVQGRRALIFGAGGAARAVCAALREARIKETTIIARNADKAVALAKEFAARVGAPDLASVLRAVRQADLVVNATPLGMDGQTSPVGPAVSWKEGALAYDLIYRPLETPFLKQARQTGAQTLGGLAMLVAQAAATWRIWFEEEISPDSVAAIDEHLRRSLA